MKAFLGVCVGALTALSVVAWRLQPKADLDGRHPVVWVSDPNPLRARQAQMFGELDPRYVAQIDSNNGGVEKVIVQALAGVGPDVFDCGNATQLSAFVRSGVAMDLTDALKKRGVDVARDTYAGIQGAAIYEGRVYGVPTNIAADGVWFHKDLFDAAGIAYPQGEMKWDAMIALAKRLTVRDAQGKVTRYGLMFPWWNWRHIFLGFDARVFSEDGTRCVVDRPEAIAATQLMVDLVYLHHVSPTPNEVANMASQGGFGSGDIALFGAKRSAMAIGGRWWLSQLRNAKGLRLGVFESPHQIVRRFRGYGRATLVNAATRDPEAALDFVAYIASREFNRLINAQADGISAFRAYAQGDAFLHDPAHPEEDGNAVWRTLSERAVSDQISPFIDGSVADRLLQTQFDLVQNRLKTPERAMRDAARAINAEIQRNVKEDPKLAVRYQTLVARASRPWVSRASRSGLLHAKNIPSLSPEKGKGPRDDLGPGRDAPDTHGRDARATRGR
ncbi:MAG: extracellular solute-binding protein [Fimbriimonas sp.]